MQIRPMTPADATAVLTIYQTGLDTGNASFETTAPDWDTFDATKLPDHRLVACHDDTVTGWIAATATSARPAYAGVVEHSIYVAEQTQGRGVANALLAAFIDSSEQGGIWTIQSGIFPENTASLALHAKHGFRIIGTRERIGRHHGRWRDVTLIERRSRTTGTD